MKFFAWQKLDKMKNELIDKPEIAIAVFKNHIDAEQAIRKLHLAGLDMNSLSIVGQGYHPTEKVIGFYNMGERVAFWGSRGAFWGGLWGIFASGMFVTTTLAAPIIALGFFAVTIITALESAVVIGGLSAIIAALYSLGIPKDRVIVYENALKSDKFIVMANGSSQEIILAKELLKNMITEIVASHKIKQQSHEDIEKLNKSHAIA